MSGLFVKRMLVKDTTELLRTRHWIQCRPMGIVKGQ